MIKHIKIKEKEYPIRVSYYALKKTKEVTGKSLSGVKDDDYEIYEELVYHALVSGARAEKQEAPFKRDEMEEVLDECFMEFVALIPSFFPAPKKEVAGESKEEEETVEKK